MSFNLRYDNQGDGENAWGFRKDEAAAVIRELGPALLGVQEATYPMLQDLEARLPDYEWIGVGRNGGLQSEFSAVLYQPRQLQPVWVGHFWLSHEPQTPGTRYPGAGCTRMCTWVQFRRRGGQEEFLFYNTHLDHQNDEARIFGGSMVRDHIAEKQSRDALPAILVGDMNAHPQSAPLQAMRHKPDGSEFLYDTADWLRKQGINAGNTFHGFRGGASGEPIDYILYTQGWQVRTYAVFRDKVHNRYPSDHYPILADLTL